MEVSMHEQRTLTVLDHTRLQDLMPNDRRLLEPHIAGLVEDIPDNADLVPSRDIPADVVTMRSQVLLQDLATAQRHTLTMEQVWRRRRVGAVAGRRRSARTAAGRGRAVEGSRWPRA